MTIDTIVNNLVDLHKEAQEDGGFDDSDTVSPNTVPLNDLEGFDSMLIPQLTRELGKAIGHQIPKGTKIKNLYCKDGEMKSIREIAESFIATFLKETHE
ncbi:MAG: hypothetical protein P1V20_04995 [Verrucomicrobiales bacterium]|nr:hypothetical protein [Verrucomicrobiales bacterium]